MQLEMQLGISDSEVALDEWRGQDIGNMLKQEGTQLWEEPNSNANNSSGFDAIPSGYRHGSGEFLDLGKTSRYWTSTASNNARYRRLDYDNSGLYRGYSGVFRGYSVRCVKG